MGHTDVVPVNPDGWRHDPFGGELIDGEVWGRGAVDMLNLTASMAVATKRLARNGFRPKGTLVYLAVADEEALGSMGAGHLVEHEADSVRADYVITESGGIPIPSPTGLKLPVIVAEKGSFWVRLRVSGTPGHGSQPYKTDNALVTAAAVVQRIAEYQPRTEIPTSGACSWRMEYPDGSSSRCSIPPVRRCLRALPVGMARQFRVHPRSRRRSPTGRDQQSRPRRSRSTSAPGDGDVEVRAFEEALGDLSRRSAGRIRRGPPTVAVTPFGIHRCVTRRSTKARRSCRT
jgi:hypothetical protein